MLQPPAATPVVAAHLLEAAVAAVAEQEVGTPVGHVQVDAAVAVGIAGAHAVAPGGRVDAGRGRDVLEAPVAQIAVERVAVRNAGAGVVQLRPR